MEFIGFNLSVIICSIVVVALLLLAAGFGVFQWKGPFEMWPGVTSVVMVVLALFPGLYLAIVTFPYQEKYISVYELSGTVTDISNVLTEDGGELARSVIVQLDSYDEPITMNNPRNVSLAGKDVTLICEYGFVAYGMDNTFCELRSLN